MILETTTINLTGGLHALNAVRLSEIVRSTQSLVFLRSPRGTANARDVVSVLALALHCGESAEILADGADERAALERVRAFLEQKNTN